jgi:hypothetical protein
MYFLSAQQSCYFMISPFLGTFTELQKVTMDIVMSGCVESSATAGWFFSKFYTTGFYHSWTEITGNVCEYLYTSMATLVTSVTLVAIGSSYDKCS